MSAFEQRMIEVEGATLEVILAGTGEPVVCRSHPFDVVGEPASAAPWHWSCAPGRTVGVNPRGVGISSAGRGPHDFTFRQHTDDLEAVRRELGIDRWVFRGISGGGAIALLYALAYPAALSGLIAELVGPGGRRIAADPESILNPYHPQYGQVVAAPSVERRPAVLAAQESQPTTDRRDAGIDAQHHNILDRRCNTPVTRIRCLL